MTLTYKFDLDILPLYLHAEIQVCVSGHESGNIHTDRQTHHVKTILKLITSQTWDVIIL